MAYVNKFQGYVADVPELWFKRIDGRIFHYDKLTQASVTPNVNFTEVNAGWGLYPVAYLPAASSLEMQFTSGQFDSSLFALANGGDFAADATFKQPVTKLMDVTGNTGSITSTVQLDVADFTINGMTRGTADPASTGHYKVVESGASGAYTYTFTFYAGDFANGSKVEVTYLKLASNALTIASSNDKAAVGEAILKWPVYNGGEVTDETTGTFSANNEKGYIIMDIYRCRITQMPGFDTSYKTNATNSITLSTMDPTNTDRDGAYQITYIPNV